MHNKLIVIVIVFSPVLPQQIIPQPRLISGLSVNGSLGRIEALTDGIIPALRDLEGNDWARDLVVIPNQDQANAELIFDFDANNVAAIIGGTLELVMLNCPEWNIGTGSINVEGGFIDPRAFQTAGVTGGIPTSCEHYVHVCIPAPAFPLQTLTFLLNSSSAGSAGFVHIAEVIFNNPFFPCPSDLEVISKFFWLHPN